MTNNPTIDGVSRELMQNIDDLLYIMTGHDSYPKLVHKYGKEWWAPINELRGEICALLDATDICPTCDCRGGCPDCKPEPEPAVERQEPVSAREMLRQQFEEKNGQQGWFVAGGSSESDTPEGFVYGDFTTDMCWTCYFQVADTLQSTIAQLQTRIAELESGRLAVWYGAMPESNGKTNWTAILHRKGEPIYEGCCITLDRSEYPDRVRYEADRVRYLIGELEQEPFILDYDANKHSGYTTPPAPVAVADKYDDVLLPFLSLMRAELHANAHKGDRLGWLQMDRKTAVLEVFYHLGKLHQAVHRDEAAAIKEYAADVANMCMMLLDVCACLDATAALNEVKP